MPETKTASSSRTKKKRAIKSEIIAHFQEYLLLHGTQPASVYAFCRELKIEEAEFYRHFSSFAQVASAFWQELLHATRSRLENTAEYAEFNTREKLLSFYFSFFEALKTQRSYALLTLNQDLLNPAKENSELIAFKKDFKIWVNQLLVEGRSRSEIAGRSKFNDYYDQLFWMQFLFLLDFWRKDHSAGFERSDEAIEKGVNLSFDLIEKNALDSAFDFGKFLFQNR